MTCSLARKRVSPLCVVSPVYCRLHMKLLDLFTGTGSVARVARELGNEVTSLDINPRCEPTVCADILHLNYRDTFSPNEFDIVWASPPCETFSCARKCNISTPRGSRRCV